MKIRTCAMDDIKRHPIRHTNKQTDQVKGKITKPL
jgi:hypothetical protein